MTGHFRGFAATGAAFMMALACAASAQRGEALLSLEGVGAALSASEVSVEVRVTELRWPAAEDNLLPDGGVESNSHWAFVGDQSLFAEDRDDPAEGERAAVIMTPRQTGAVTALRSDEVSIEGEGELVFTGQFRIEGGIASAGVEGLNRAGVLVQWLSSGGSVLEEEYALTLEGNFERWKRLTRPLDPPRDARALRFIVGTQVTSPQAQPLTFAVDDMALYRTSDLVAATVTGEISAALASGEPVGERITAGDLQVFSTAEAVGDAVRLTVTVQTASDEPSVGWIDLSVPIAGDAPLWHPDLIRSEPLHGALSWTATADRTGDLPMSVFPMAAVSSSAGTLGIVIPPTEPSIIALSGIADPSPRLCARIHVGAVPGRTDRHTLWLHRGPESWGARGVFAAHATMNQDDFQPRGVSRRVVQMGTAHPGRPVRGPEDFGMTFLQSEELDDPSSAQQAVARAQQIGAQLAQYILPWADEPTVAHGNRELPPIEAALEEQAAGAGERGTRRALREAGARSNVLDTNGTTLVAETLRPAWRDHDWVLRLPQNLDTRSGEGRGSLTLDLVRQAEVHAEENGVDAFPVQMDNFMMDSAFVLTDEAAIESCEGPLTHSPNTLEPAAPLAENHLRWLEALSGAVGSDAILSGNVLRGGIPRLGVPFLDAIAFECRAAAEPSNSEEWTLEDLAWRRALAGRRPVAAMVNVQRPQGERWDPETVREFVEGIWHRCLVFAIVPTIKEAWGPSDQLEAIRPLYRDLLPVAERLQELGWRPDTAAQATESGFVIERYGDEDDVTLAIHSPQSAPQEVTVQVNWAWLGIDPPRSVREILSGEALPVRDNSFRVQLDPHRTAVVQLR